MAGIVLAMLFVSLPFLVDGAREAFALVDERYEHVARTLGSSRFGAFARVTFPQAWRGVLAGAVLMWGRGISEFGAVVILAYNPKVISVLTFERFEGFGLRAAQPPAVLIVHRRVRRVPAGADVPGAAAAALEDGGAVIELRGLEVEAGGFRVGPLDLVVGDGRYVVLLGPERRRQEPRAGGGGRRAAGGRGRGPAGRRRRDALCSPERRRVGLVFQDGLLFPHLTVAANIAYGMRGEGGAEPAPATAPAGPRRARRRGRAARRGGRRDGAARPPPGDALGRRASAGRAGARARRPARARCCSTSRSAPWTRRRARRCRRCCAGSAASGGLPVLHVTHDRDEAFALADECAVMIAGRLHQTGRPLDVLRRPADAAVARFLGARNVLPARRDPRDPRVAVLHAGGSLRAAGPLPDEAVVVVRPEDLRLSAAPGARHARGHRHAPHAAGRPRAGRPRGAGAAGRAGACRRAGRGGDRRRQVVTVTVRAAGRRAPAVTRPAGSPPPTRVTNASPAVHLASHGRLPARNRAGSTTCASPSPTAATCAARTACRRRASRRAATARS